MSKNREIKINKKFLSGIILAILVVAVLTPIYRAEAISHSSAVSGIASSAIQEAIAGVLEFVKGAMTGLIAQMGSMVDSIINQPVAGVGIVKSSWELVRGFANMFFIIALIVMAFGTIFNIGGYDIRSLVARFLIAALLVNFSLVIGEIIIDWTASLSDVFIQAIGNVGARIGQGANLGSSFTTGVSNNASTNNLTLWQNLIGIFANIILLSIILFSMGVLLFFVIVRIPILWALLIISPIAWILYILPTTKKYSQMWWDYFISWNIFLPIYLFFIYFGVLFLNQQQSILSNTSGAISILPGIAAGTVTQTIFFYVLIGLFLIYGAKVAMSFSRAGGAGAVAGYFYGKGAVMRRAAWRGTGIPGAYKEAKDYYGREGIPIGKGRRIFGTRQAEEREAKIASMLRVPGVAEKQLAKKIDAEKTRLKDKRSGENELDTLIKTSRNPATRIAAIQRLQDEFGRAPTADQVTNILEGLDLNTETGAKIFKQLNLGEMSSNDLRQLRDPANPKRVTNRSAELSILKTLIDKGTPKQEEIKRALELAKGGQGGNLVKKAKESIAKSFNEKQRMDLLTSIGTGAENADARREILSIMAAEGDSEYFYQLDSTGNLDHAKTQNKLKEAANSFENVGDRRKFLEDTAKKYAHSAAAVMLADGEIKLRDLDGNEITAATPDAEFESTKAVLRKLNIDEKESQNKKQINPVLDRALGEDMARDIEKYARSDKWESFQKNFVEAQRKGRQIAYKNEYFRPFLEIAKELSANIKKLTGAISTDPIRASEERADLKKSVDKLQKLRDDYKKTCEKNHLTVHPIDRKEVDANIAFLSKAIDMFKNKIRKL